MWAEANLPDSRRPGCRTQGDSANAVYAGVRKYVKRSGRFGCGHLRALVEGNELVKLVKSGLNLGSRGLMQSGVSLPRQEPFLVWFS